MTRYIRSYECCDATQRLQTLPSHGAKTDAADGAGGPSGHEDAISQSDVSASRVRRGQRTARLRSTGQTVLRKDTQPLGRPCKSQRRHQTVFAQLRQDGHYQTGPSRRRSTVCHFGSSLESHLGQKTQHRRCSTDLARQTQDADQVDAALVRQYEYDLERSAWKFAEEVPARTA